MKKKTEIRQTYLQQRKKKMLSDVVFFVILGSFLSLPGLIFSIAPRRPLGPDEIGLIYLNLCIIWGFMGAFIYIYYRNYSRARIGVHYDGKYLYLQSDDVIWNSKVIKVEMGFYIEPVFIKQVKWMEDRVDVYLNKEYPEYDKMSYLSVSKKFIDDEDRFRKELNMLGINIE